MIVGESAAVAVAMSQHSEVAVSEMSESQQEMVGVEMSLLESQEATLFGRAIDESIQDEEARRASMRGNGATESDDAL